MRKWPTEHEKVWAGMAPKPIHYDPKNYYVETDLKSNAEVELTPIQVSRIFKGIDACAIMDLGGYIKLKGKSYERANGAKNVQSKTN